LKKFSHVCTQRKFFAALCLSALWHLGILETYQCPRCSPALRFSAPFSIFFQWPIFWHLHVVLSAGHFLHSASLYSTALTAPFQFLVLPLNPLLYPFLLAKSLRLVFKTPYNLLKIPYNLRNNKILIKSYF